MLDWFGKRLREMQEVKRDERGFTLIELLVVIIIIGILAGIAIPAFLSQRDRAAQESARANVRSAGTAQVAFYTQNGNYAADAAALAPAGFRQGTPNVAVFGNASNYCVSATGGGTVYRMTQADGQPQSGAGVAACTAP